VSRWWRRHGVLLAEEASGAPAKPGTTPLRPDSECKAGYLVVGNAKLHGAGYENPNVRLHDVDGGADLQITPSS